MGGCAWAGGTRVQTAARLPEGGHATRGPGSEDALEDGAAAPPVCLLENPMDRGARGVAKSGTWLSG